MSKKIIPAARPSARQIPLTFFDLVLAAGPLRADDPLLLQEVEAPSWLPSTNPEDQVGHNYYPPLDGDVFGDGPDSLERVMKDLAELPALKPWQYKPLLHGGWHEYAEKPPTHTEVQVYETDEFGQTYVRMKLRSLEDKCPVEVASGQQTLSFIRNMREATWTPDQAFSMLNRGPVIGGTWLFTRHCPEAQFWKAWELAAEPLGSLGQKKFKSKMKGTPEFVSHQSDRDRVYLFIEENPGLGRNELLRSGCGLTGKKIEGRIKKALEILKQYGQVRTEPGRNRAQFHFVEMSRVISLAVRQEVEERQEVEAEAIEAV